MKEKEDEKGKKWKEEVEEEKKWKEEEEEIISIATFPTDISAFFHQR